MHTTDRETDVGEVEARRTFGVDEAHAHRVARGRREERERGPGHRAGAQREVVEGDLRIFGTEARLTDEVEPSALLAQGQGHALRTVLQGGAATAHGA